MKEDALKNCKVSRATGTVAGRTSGPSASISYRCKRKRQGGASLEGDDKRLEAELDALIRKDEAAFRGLHASVQEKYINGHVSSREMRIHEGTFLRLALGFYDLCGAT